MHFLNEREIIDNHRIVFLVHIFIYFGKVGKLSLGLSFIKIVIAFIGISINKLR